MKKFILTYALVIAGMITLLRLLDYHFMMRSLKLEFYLGTVALMFVFIGIWIGWRVNTRSKIMDAALPSTAVSITNTVIPELIISNREEGVLIISKREEDVLKLMAEGLSNQEIADKLFVSLNTVKTHSSNLFVKLDVKRRTQAIQRARELGILS